MILQSQYPQYTIRETDQPQIVESARIYVLLINGKCDEIIEIIQEQLRAIKHAGHVEESLIQCIFYAHVTAFIHALQTLHGIHCAEEVPVYDGGCDVALLFRRLESFTAALCGQVNDLRRSQESEFKHEVLAFVQAHAFDSELYIKMVTTRFHINESTLQRIIRDQTGKSFFVYIEQMRMEKANHLLQSTHMPINELITACGYSSMNSFYKAYKKNFGVSPSAIRKTPAGERTDKPTR